MDLNRQWIQGMYLISDNVGNYYTLSDKYKGSFRKVKRNRALICRTELMASLVAREICAKYGLSTLEVGIGNYEITEDGNLELKHNIRIRNEQRITYVYRLVRTSLVNRLMWNGEDNLCWGAETRDWYIMNDDRLDWKSVVVINGDPNKYTVYEMQVLFEVSRLRTENYDTLGYYRKGMNLIIVNKDEYGWTYRRAVNDSAIIRKGNLKGLVYALTHDMAECRCYDGKYRNYQVYLRGLV